jgi:hypothetical protein
MPLARYFLLVGGALLALLFITDAYLPKLPVADSSAEAVDMPVIRIHTDRKWPERIVFDTRIPTITPRPAENTVASVAAPSTVADVSAKVRVREAFAQLPPPPDQARLQSDPKKPEPKLQHRRKIARNRVAPPTMLVAQQPRFGFFASGMW